jgi:hypothetical protein
MNQKRVIFAKEPEKFIEHAIVHFTQTNPGNYNMTYVTEYTNAPYLVSLDFKGPAGLDGLFSGYGYLVPCLRWSLNRR